MKDTDGSKYYTYKEKCYLMERTWRDVFRTGEKVILDSILNIFIPT